MPDVPVTSDTPRTEALTREEEADLRRRWPRTPGYDGPVTDVDRLLATLDAECATRQIVAPDPEDSIEGILRRSIARGQEAADTSGLPVEGDRDFDATATDYRRGSPQYDPKATNRLRDALRDANAIIAMTRRHLADDHPDCAFAALGVLNDASRAALSASDTSESQLNPDPLYRPGREP